MTDRDCFAAAYIAGRVAREPIEDDVDLVEILGYAYHLADKAIAAPEYSAGGTMPIVRPVHAHEGDVVDIHWRLKNGTLIVERREAPAKPTREAEAYAAGVATGIDLGKGKAE